MFSLPCIDRIREHLLQDLLGILRCSDFDGSGLLLYSYDMFIPSNRGLPHEPLCLPVLWLHEIRKTQWFAGDVMQSIARLCNTMIVMSMPVIVPMSMPIILWTNIL